MDMIWYESLNKPLFTPPDDIFTPAWIYLYVLIFLALFTFIYTKSEKDKKLGYFLFSIQMVLNFAWMPAFFFLKNITMSFVIIIFMLVFTFMTIAEFFKISKMSAALLVPYILWICFAAYLNYGMMYLNTPL